MRFTAPALVVSLLAPGSLALAVEEDPQQHEVDAVADITIEQGGNSAYLDVRYLFTPAGIDRNDEIVPILRRFVRHPTAFWIGLKRNGSTTDSQTGGYLGGRLDFLSGRFYALGQVGFEKDTMEIDPQEDGYWAAPYHLEGGVRVAPLVSLGAFYEGRPVTGVAVDPNVILPATRDGGESTIGGAIDFSTPNDRLILHLTGGWYNADWTFANFHPGRTTAEGVVVGMHLDYQLSANFSVGAQLDFSRLHWYDDRIGDDDPTWLGTDGDICMQQGSTIVCHIERDVYHATLTGEIVYWFKSRLGFRFSVGGGYSDAAPLFGDRRRGISKFGFGFVTRF